MKLNLKAIALAAIAAFAVQTASAQLTLTGTSYTQGFNDLESGILPDGWETRTNATANSLGVLVPWGTGNYLAISNYWKAFSGKFGNHAAVGSFTGEEDAATQQAALDRALAIRQTGSFGDGRGAFLLKLANTTGFGTFSMNVDFMQLDPQPRTTVWTVDYGLGDEPTVFTPVLLYTNSATVFSSSNVTVSFGGALDNQPSTVWIRVVALDRSTGSGNRDTFGIDNFTLNYSPFSGVTPITIEGQPQSRTNDIGTAATFSVSASGTAPTYQWRKNGANVSDDGYRISGATAASLQILNVNKDDEGDYTVVVGNSAGSKTSEKATLTVKDPAISSGPSPAQKTIMPGDLINLYATANGSEPMTFQWRKDGVDISGANDGTATGTNFISKYMVASQPSDSGAYTLYVQNAQGNALSATSSITVLTVPANRIARWNFNDDSITNDVPASSGTGTATLVGSTTATYPSGTYSDPTVLNLGLNYGWNVTTYPPQGSSNKVAGLEFKVSTVGQKNITVAWEERHSNTSSKYQRFQYSTDGVSFNDGPVITCDVTDLSFATHSVDLSAYSGVNNNPNFAFRLVAEWESTAVGSGANEFLGTVGSYFTGGTIRFDLMTVYGNTFTGVTPIPLNIARDGNNVVFTWSDSAFKLQSADSLTSTWTTIDAAATGYSAPATGTKFYRLIAQ